MSSDNFSLPIDMFSSVVRCKGSSGAELDEQLEALASQYMASTTENSALDERKPCPFSTRNRDGIARDVSMSTATCNGAKVSSTQGMPTCKVSSPNADRSAAPISWQRGQMLGAGSFGRVYFGLNSLSGELMAVKQISYTPGQSTEATRQAAQALQREVRLLQSFSHPNIVRYLGVERDDINGVISIMLEYCAGGSIASLLDKFGAFNESLTRSYVRMVLSGLHFLHTRPGGGILHRDIKGANVLVDSDGVCKLADFGASKLLQQDLQSTQDGGCRSLRGTPYWMAPEVIRQTGHGRPADVWSLGCTMLEMLTAKPPWSHFSSQISALFHIASSKAPPPLPHGLSHPAACFILRMLVRDPKERADTAELCDHPFLSAVAGQEQRVPNSREGVQQAQNARPFSQAITATGSVVLAHNIRETQAFCSLSRQMQKAGKDSDVNPPLSALIPSSTSFAVNFVSSTLPTTSDTTVSLGLSSQPLSRVYALGPKGQSTPQPHRASDDSEDHQQLQQELDASACLAVVDCNPTSCLPLSSTSAKARTSDDNGDEGSNPKADTAPTANSSERIIGGMDQHCSEGLPPYQKMLKKDGWQALQLSSGHPTIPSAAAATIGWPIRAPMKGESSGFAVDRNFRTQEPHLSSQDDGSAVAAAAADEVAQGMRQQREQETRLLQEKAKKKVLWEEELQRELEYQRHQKATREAHRSSIGQVGRANQSGAIVFPE